MLQQIPSHEDTGGGVIFLLDSRIFWFLDSPSMLCYAVCLLVKATTHPNPSPLAKIKQFQTKFLTNLNENNAFLKPSFDALESTGHPLRSNFNEHRGFCLIIGAALNIWGVVKC